jgi:protein O-GlcNAc transferase
MNTNIISVHNAMRTALAHHQVGQLTQADAIYRQILQQQPDHPDALYLLGLIADQTGNTAIAIELYREALNIKPDYAEAHQRLGLALKNQGKLDEAIVCYREALALEPGSADTYHNLGVALAMQGKLNKAADSYRNALIFKPDFAETLCNLGIVLRDQGKLDEAAASFHNATAIKPDYVEAHCNLGNLLINQGEHEKAAASFRNVLAIKPDYVEVYNDLGNILKDQGKLEQAVANYRNALAIKPDYAEVHYNLGNALMDQGEHEQAVASYRNALAIRPDYAGAYNGLGNALNDQGKPEQAVASYLNALVIKPDYAEAHYNLANMLRNLGKHEEAIASYHNALAIKPDYADAYNNLGVALQDLGKLDKAIASFRMALGIKPDHIDTYSNLLFGLSHDATIDADTLFAEHCRFGEQFETPLLVDHLQHTNTRNPERTLRIGFVSGDFFNHAVAYFIEPVLAHLSRSPRLSLYAYYNNTLEDAFTQRIQTHFTQWHVIATLSDSALADKIRADSIDILIDLSGHTAKNRLLTFARKPAPVQTSWMGYAGTTGLMAMDYYLIDRFSLPSEQFDRQFTEKIVRLAVNPAFLPAEGAPSVNALPALRNGYMTFGSFNRLSKLSPSVIALWSQLLQAMPDSKMMLGGMPEEGKYNELIGWFEQEGIMRERLSFHTHCGIDAYLGLHHQVDICLDTFPYNGGTTTFHALWMGIPTLTLAGSTPAGRSGVSILCQAGLEAFVALDNADFVQKGLSWADNHAILSDIRKGLRKRFTMSAMGQPAVVAAGIERAWRIMWQQWCAGLPAESFELPLQDINNVTLGDDK